jgi:hypothetical protein
MDARRERGFVFHTFLHGVVKQVCHVSDYNPTFRSHNLLLIFLWHNSSRRRGMWDNALFQRRIFSLWNFYREAAKKSLADKKSSRASSLCGGN